jgi:hypothetical protein
MMPRILARKRLAWRRRVADMNLRQGASGNLRLGSIEYKHFLLGQATHRIKVARAKGIDHMAY